MIKISIFLCFHILKKNIFWSTNKGNERFYHTMVLYLFWFPQGLHKVHGKEPEKYEIESCSSKIKHFQRLSTFANYQNLTSVKWRIIMDKPRSWVKP